MTFKTELSKHPSLTHSNDIADICKPLHKLGITYFAHVNIDDVGHFSAINNNPGFYTHYMENNYYNADIHLAGKNIIKDYFVWDSVERCGLSAKMHQEAGAFGVKHTFTIVTPGQNGNDYFHFATNQTDKTINQVYLANIDLLNLFIMHFKDKIMQSKHLREAYQLKFSIDENAHGYLIQENLADAKNEARRQFLKEISLQKFAAPLNAQALTIKEIEILFWLHHGKTTHDISQIVHVAEVTINKRITNIKRKLKCYTQFQLGEYFSAMFQHSSEIINHLFADKS